MAKLFEPASLVAKPACWSLTMRVCTNSEVAEATRAVRRHRHAVVDHVGEDVGADLQLGQHARLVIEIVRAGAAAGDDRAGEAGRHAGASRAAPSIARAAMRLRPPLGIVGGGLAMARIALDASQPSAGWVAITCASSTAAAGEVTPKRWVPTSQSIRTPSAEAGGGRRLAQHPDIGRVLHDHGQVGERARQRDQPVDLGRMPGPARSARRPPKPRIRQHLGLAQLGAALADCTGRHLASGDRHAICGSWRGVAVRCRGRERIAP